MINQGDLDVADELIAPDHVNHDPTASKIPSGPGGISTDPAFGSG
ncbi:MAG: nuclear transport factor 2 family protein [Actinomycetota bacterium]|nr:nuclear transport factor 2 family protein [Actinomycetota bacterium]